MVKVGILDVALLTQFYLSKVWHLLGGAFLMRWTIEG